MKLLKSINKSLMLISFVTAISCSSNVQPTSNEFGIDSSSIEVGTEEAGKYTKKADKTFSSNDKIILKFKANGLTIKDSKVKTNIDLFLKKDKDILGTENDILGKDDLTENIMGVEPTYTGTNGSANIQISITPPSATKGELVANITLKDLNSSGKLVSFETKFTLK